MGIAQVCLLNGFKAVLNDASEELLARCVDAGYIGKKSGRGFHSYGKE